MSLIPLTTPHFHTPLYPPHLAPYREKFIAKIQNSSSHNTQPHIKVSSPTTQKKTEAAKVQLLNMQKSGIKEGIRKALEELGRAQEEEGEELAAAQTYASTKDYCVAPQHIIDMCTNVLRLPGDDGIKAVRPLDSDRLLFTNSPQRIGQSAKAITDAGTTNKAQVSLAAAIVNIEQIRYKKAAHKILDVNQAWNEIITGAELAQMLVLTSLASCTRQELKTILDNPTYKEIMSNEGMLKDLMEHFYRNRFRQCTDALQSMINDFLINPYLNAHVYELFGLISQRCVAAYVLPYSSVLLSRMAGSLGFTEPELIEKIESCFKSGLLHGRLDLQNMVFLAPLSDSSYTMSQNVYKAQSKYVENMGRLNLNIRVLEYMAQRLS